MTGLAMGISPEMLRPLGWTLLHFLWQGVALAAVLAALFAIVRTASARYAVAVGTLVMMLAAPIGTFLWLQRGESPQQSEASVIPDKAEPAALVSAGGNSLLARHVPASPTRENNSMLSWLVMAWFAGVVLLSLRTAGGLFVLDRLRRKETFPLNMELQEKFAALQRRMRLDRIVRYCECRRIDAPAVIGWFRPMIVLPATALTGLDEAQLEAVIAHELAHIRRYDSYLNLFQIAVETLLFYHPAVWWVSQRVRAERENCCDDAALSVCGDAVGYARALTLMEEWRSAPALAVAANGSPLGARVMRLLGLRGNAAAGIRVAGLSAGVLCLGGALLAGNAFLGVAHASFDFDKSENQQQDSSTQQNAAAPSSVHTKGMKGTGLAVAVPVAVHVHLNALAPIPSSHPEIKGYGILVTPDPTSEPQVSASSYIDSMSAAGLKDLTVDQLISLKIQGVTPEYVKTIRDLGFKVDADEVIAMKVQGITPDYIREMRAIDPNLGVDELIGMKTQGINAKYANEIQEAGVKAKSDELIAMKVQGITPEYIREMAALGFKVDADDLIAAKVQGINAAYVKQLQSAGFKNLTLDDCIAAKVQGITLEFIEEARKHGFKDLTLDKLIALKNADVL